MTRKRVLFLGSALAAVLAALMTADRAAAAILEDRLADRFRCATGAAEAPDVEVDGFPALTQLATGRLDRVDITAHDVTVGTAKVTHIRARATEVHLSGGTVSARTVTVFATVSYPDLAGYVESGGSGAAPDLRIVGGGEREQLILRADVVVDNRSVPATVYADVSIIDNWLIIDPEEAELSAAVGLRPNARVDVVQEPVRTLGLPALPADLDYQAAGGDPEGLQVLAAGSDLRLPDRAACGG